MKTRTKSMALVAIATTVTLLLSSTMLVNACSIVLPEITTGDGSSSNVCQLTGLRATNNPYLVQGTIERYSDKPDARQVYIDLKTKSIIIPRDKDDHSRPGVDNRQRQRGLRSRTGRSPTVVQEEEDDDEHSLDGIEIAPWPVPQPPSQFSVQASGSTVSIQSMGRDIYTFELAQAAYDPTQGGDRLSFLVDKEMQTIWVFYAKNRSYWGGVQVTRVNLRESTSYTLPREEWNESGDAWFMTEGEIPYYPDLKLAVLHHSDGMCGSVFALYNKEWKMESRNAIRSPFMMGFSSTPVYYAQTPQEDSIVFTLTSGYNATTASIERVNVRTGHVIQQLTIDKDDIDAAGGCSSPMVGETRRKRGNN